MSFKQTLGLHLRLKDSLSALVQEASVLGLSCIQFFLVEQKEHQYVPITAKDRQTFLAARESFLRNVFIHSSYWINPASHKKEVFSLSRTLLRRELRVAASLEVPYVVLHAGSSKGHIATPEDPLAKRRGLETVAKMLNMVLKREQKVTILLENAAHGKRTLGNDLYDFLILKNLLDAPEKVQYCLDTAHAFSYGYDVAKTTKFLDFVDETMGFSNIKLIHLNDAEHALGSLQDRHAFPGQGSLGKEALLPFLHHPAFKKLPKIVEAPAAGKQTLLDNLADLAGW